MKASAGNAASEPDGVGKITRTTPYGAVRTLSVLQRKHLADKKPPHPGTLLKVYV